MSKKLKLNVPGSLNQITLGQYQEYLSDVSNYADEVVEIQKSLISIFCNVPRKTVELFNGSQIEEVTSLLISLLTVKDHKLKRLFTIEDTEFGFIPDLEDSTFSEWTDIDAYLADHTKWHKLAAILFRPLKTVPKTWFSKEKKIKKWDVGLQDYRYDVEEYVNTRKYAEAMRLMPLDVFLGGYSFFSALGIELLKTIPSYLEDQMASKEIQQRLRGLVKNGDGLGPTIASLKETLEDYKKSIDLMF